MSATGTLSLLPGDPTEVGPYRLLGRLGAGGMGVVYLGVDGKGTRAAVKVVKPEVDADPDFRVRFTREVSLARKVTDKFTARVLEADTEAEQQWVATEYVPGPTLAEHVRTHGGLPAPQARLLGIGLAEAVDAIHHAGLVHRDLKPGNVILSGTGPRIIDFGIAYEPGATRLTQAGGQPGSLEWMSPEQCRGAPVGQPSDIFSLGLVIAFSATGENPYGTGAPVVVANRRLHEPPNLSELPDSLANTVTWCLQEKPEDRPSASEVASDLVGDTDTNPAAVVSAGWDTTIASSSPEPPAPPHANHSLVPIGSTRLRRILAVAATLLGIGISAWLLTVNTDAPSDIVAEPTSSPAKTANDPLPVTPTPRTNEVANTPTPSPTASSEQADRADVTPDVGQTAPGTTSANTGGTPDNDRSTEPTSGDQVQPEAPPETTEPASLVPEPEPEPASMVLTHQLGISPPEFIGDEPRTVTIGMEDTSPDSIVDVEIASPDPSDDGVCPQLTDDSCHLVTSTAIFTNADGAGNTTYTWRPSSGYGFGTYVVTVRDRASGTLLQTSFTVLAP